MTLLQRYISIFLALIVTIGSFTACATSGNKEKGAELTTVTVWTYYSGTAKDAFDSLIAEFNGTVGKEKNIMVEAYSQGDVNELADAVLSAAKKDAGAEPMPNIFATYADSAYQIDELGMLCDLEKYFSKDEISTYRKEFTDSGRLVEKGKLKILPVAKSSENLFINSTEFDKFSAATGVSYDNLKTWEGITKAAEVYYAWSGGKAFFGIDSMANFMLLGAAQQGNEMYSIQNGKNVITFSKKTAEKIWDNFYVPYVNGYFTSFGRFRSDDTKTGDIIAYVGSTSGSAYFPTAVEEGIDSVHPIGCKVMEFPIFENGKKIAVSQGAGMSISKSDEASEEASATFLKWFTAKKQNLRFAALTGYMPVKTDALNLNDYNKLLESDKNIPNSETIKKSTEATYKMLDEYILYENKPFKESYDVRKVLEHSLIDLCKNDLQEINSKIASGMERGEAIGLFTTREHFNAWYDQFVQETSAVISK